MPSMIPYVLGLHRGQKEDLQRCIFINQGLLELKNWQFWLLLFGTLFGRWCMRTLCYTTVCYKWPQVKVGYGVGVWGG